MGEQSAIHLLELGIKTDHAGQAMRQEIYRPHKASPAALGSLLQVTANDEVDMDLLARILNSLAARLKTLRGHLVVLIWRLRGVKVGRNVRVYGRVTLQGRGDKLQIGDDVSFNEGVHMELRDRILIGKRCHVSSGVRLHTGSLIRDDSGQLSHVSAPIEIGDDVWLATMTLVIGGVKIADQVTIAANSVVTRSISESGTYAGTPARRLEKAPLI